MIDVNDLMCGNWLYNNMLGRSLQIVNIPQWLREEAYDPIPVTEDMLKRIGFEEKKGIYPETLYRYWDKEYRYKLDVYPDFSNSDRKFSIHIDNEYCETIGSGEFTYVHELQNLVRINCREDLPITKEMLYEEPQRQKVASASAKRSVETKSLWGSRNKVAVLFGY